MQIGEQGYAAEEGVDTALAAIAALAGDIGPRAPTSHQEEAAADWFHSRLNELGLASKRDPFPAYRSFGRLYMPLFGLALAAGRARRTGMKLLLGGAAGLIGYWEGEFRSWGLLSKGWRGRSQNVYAVVEPTGRVERTVCLVSHLDSSRSGVMFSPSITPYLGRILAGVSGAVGVQAGSSR